MRLDELPRSKRPLARAKFDLELAVFNYGETWSKQGEKNFWEAVEVYVRERIKEQHENRSRVSVEVPQGR